jgi:hypothetical protein
LPLEIPDLAPDQVAILTTIDEDGPTAVPISALFRLDGSTVLVALARRRASLARARRDPRAALSLSGPGFSICARGSLGIVAEPLPGADFMTALRFAAVSVWDARGAATEVDSGIGWHWKDSEAAGRHQRVLTALENLARR